MAAMLQCIDRGRAGEHSGRGLACAQSPEGTLTVAVATFGNERWLPHLYPGAEDVVLKPMLENLLSRDPKTGALAPMLAERWEVLEGGGPGASTCARASSSMTAMGR